MAYIHTLYASLNRKEMEKEKFEDAFINALNKNFPLHSKYFELEFKIFQELGGSIFEINKCLILEFYRASITLTNHVLERLLKIALIYNEAGINPIPSEDWSSTFEGPNEKYGTKPLGNSIELCEKLELISADEKEYLFDTIRTLMRNGFSHADPSKILAGLPDESIFFQSSFSDPEKLNPVGINQKVVPFLQAIQMDNFAKNTAFSYFNYVFELITKIELRIVDKQNKSSI
ncbi:MAG: hypothetical protein K0R51_1089 [Cytophagaceae bacterium]|nr:hypothetical protein [Cytophagaceae bacterium]